jgi:hypothetical protein
MTDPSVSLLAGVLLWLEFGECTLTDAIVNATFSRQCLHRLRRTARSQVPRRLMPRRLCTDMAEKSLKVDRKKFEGIVKNLLETPHTKRDEVKPDKKKPEKLIPPQK